MHPDLVPMYRATQERPGDDLPYAVLADFIKERERPGDTTWAHLIRLWCEARSIDRRYEHLDLSREHVAGVGRNVASGFWKEDVRRYLTVRVDKRSHVFQRINQHSDVRYRVDVSSGFTLSSGRDPGRLSFTGVLSDRRHELDLTRPDTRAAQTDITFLVVEDQEYGRKLKLDEEFDKLKKSFLWTLRGFCQCRARAVWAGPLVTELRWLQLSFLDWGEWEEHHDQLQTDFPFLKTVWITPPRWQLRYVDRHEVCMNRSWDDSSGQRRTADGEKMSLIRDFPGNKIIMPEEYIKIGLKKEWPDIEFSFRAAVGYESQYQQHQQDTSTSQTSSPLDEDGGD